MGIIIPVANAQCIQFLSRIKRVRIPELFCERIKHTVSFIVQAYQMQRAHV